MSFKSWTCVMVQKGPGIIPEDICNHLQFAACDLQLRRADRMKIVGDGPCNGIIETDWQSHLIGTRGGILFRAQVDGEEGEYFINFLLSEDDLKHGAKMIMDRCKEKNIDWETTPGKFPLSELYDFRDLKRTRSGQPLN